MKISMKVFIALVIINLSAAALKAQNNNTTGGIYLTEQDYKAGKLSYVMGNQDKLQLNSFLSSSNISLKYQGKKINLKKSEVYGYRLHNQDYRFFNNEAYVVVDTTGFMMYSRPVLVQQGKGLKPVTQYYFSTNTAEPVLALNIENLDNNFGNQPGFRYAVQNAFTGNTGFTDYDAKTNQYKIKYLYQQANRAVHATL